VREKLKLLLGNIVWSSLYRTKPQEDLNQPDFWNVVIAGDWEGEAEAFLDVLQEYEKLAGRLRDPHRPKGPRSLDLDLLLFGNEIHTSPRLILPHPRMSLRAFVLIPLLELDPFCLNPQSNLPWNLALIQLGDQGVALSARNW
jgi:2-amino-4-hydroxy-6-hydroxymethyldihydropteridine diphosphokinase